VLSKYFQRITEYECHQYFELFCDLIAYFFGTSYESGAQERIFNPQELLSVIIDQIKEYNKKAQASSSSEESGTMKQDLAEQEHIYIGLIQLTSKIIENFDITLCERVVEQKSLIQEIFDNFLFASVFQESDKPQTAVATIKPRHKMTGKKGGFGKKSKEAAFSLLMSLIKKSNILM